MSLKAKVEAIIYAAEDPVTLEQMSLLLKDVVLADLASTQENLAIEQADSAAEAALESAAEAEESSLLPELALDSAEPISPEPGPLMPSDAASASDEDSEENPVFVPDTTQAPRDGAQAEAQTEVQAEKTSEESMTENPSPDVETASAPHDSTTEVALGEGPSAPQESEPVVSEELADTGGQIPTESASVAGPETTSRKRQPKKTEKEIAEDKAVRARVREVLVELVTDYANEDRGMEIRQVAGGFRMATKPEHHDVVRAFAKSLKPPIRLSLAALETLAVIAYKQPVTGPEIADIRGVESASVLGTLLDRKLITTAGRKQVIGRPMQYKTSKEFLLRFGLNDVNELPSMEEFSQLASDGTIEIAPAEAQESPSLFEPEAQSPEAAGVAENVTEIVTGIVMEDVVVDATGEAAPETESAALQVAESPEVEATQKENLDARDQGSSLPEPQETAKSQPSDAADAADSQPQPDAESSNVPETEHPSVNR